jgi:Na+/H+-dicarboxylate symporter
MIKNSLNARMLIGALIGVILGIILNVLGKDHAVYSPMFFVADLLGGVFVDLLKMIVIPLVFLSIVTGIANLGGHQDRHRIWQYTLVYFMVTSSLAILLGFFVVNIFHLGDGLNLSLFQESMSSYTAKDMTVKDFMKEFFSGLFVNPVKAMANGMVMPTLIFALFLGIALIQLKEKAQTVLSFFREMFNVVMTIVGWIMQIAPIGIMALLAKLVASQDISLLATLGKYMAVVIGATLFHGLVVLPFILVVLGRYSLRKFFGGVREAMITAFSTSSSSATLPVTLRCVENNLGVKKEIAGFVVPLGATINMDGTALYEAVAALFIANLAGIELTVVQQIIVFFTTNLAAIGAPGIPSAGMVTMVMVLQSVGLPVEAIAILIPIDRPLDAVRTMINVEGDMVGSVVVQRLTSAPRGNS